MFYINELDYSIEEFTSILKEVIEEFYGDEKYHNHITDWSIFVQDKIEADLFEIELGEIIQYNQYEFYKEG